MENYRKDLLLEELKVKDFLEEQEIFIYNYNQESKAVDKLVNEKISQIRDKYKLKDYILSKLSVYPKQFFTSLYDSTPSEKIEVEIEESKTEIDSSIKFLNEYSIGKKGVLYPVKKIVGILILLVIAFLLLSSIIEEFAAIKLVLFFCSLGSIPVILYFLREDNIDEYAEAVEPKKHLVRLISFAKIAANIEDDVAKKHLDSYKKYIEASKNEYNKLILNDYRESLDNLLGRDFFYNELDSVNDEIDEVTNDINDINVRLGFIYPVWVFDYIDKFKDSTSSILNQDLEEYIYGYFRKLNLPIVKNITESSVIIEYMSNESKQGASKVLKSYIESILLNVPPNMLNFTLIDPIGLGQSFADLFHLTDHNKKMIDSKVWVERDQIRDKLNLIGRDIELIIQEYLRNEYSSIEEYNKNAGVVKEPYRYLVVVDYPESFDEEMTSKLISIINNGPRCGIHTVLLTNKSRCEVESYNNLKNNISNLDIITISDSVQLMNNDKRFRFVEGYLLDESDAHKLVTKVGKNSVNVDKKIKNSDILADTSRFWNELSSECIRVPIGQKGANKVQYFEIGEKSLQHALVTGATGSGKSVFLNTLIMNASLLYTPQELELYLIDFKEGIEFKNYAKHKLPHARIVSIQSEVEFAYNVIKSLVSELERRGELFGSESQSIKKIADYKNIGKSLPRILLIIDEYQKLFEGDSNISNEIATMLKDVLNRGRAFGIHVVLCSQAVRGIEYIDSDSLAQIAVRIAFKSKEGMRNGLDDSNNIVRTLSDMPGHAVYNDDFGSVGGNSVFQTSFSEEDEIINGLQMVGEKVSSTHQQRVFDGSEDVILSDKQKLTINDAINSRENANRIWLGEPVSLETNLHIEIDRQSENNIIIFGQDYDNVEELLKLFMISNLIDSDNKLYIIDYNSRSNENVFRKLGDALTKNVSYGKRNALEKIVDNVYEETVSRTESEQFDSHSIFLYLLGVHRMKELANEDLFDSDEEFSLYNKLMYILRYGPDCGIHCIFTSDTKTGFERYLGSDVFNEFGKKIVLRMSEDESFKVLGNDKATKLRKGTALYSNDYMNEVLKFRIYNLEKEEWFDRAINKIKEGELVYE